MHGGSGPTWLGILMVAREWGTVPWKLAQGSPLKWYLRWIEYHNLMQKKLEQKGR
jgi:hypothetical protein